MSTEEIPAEIADNSASRNPRAARPPNGSAWILEAFERQADRAGRERAEQAEAFAAALKDSIGPLRSDIRTFGILMLLGLLAFGGVNIAITAGAYSVAMTPAKVAP